MSNRSPSNAGNRPKSDLDHHRRAFRLEPRRAFRYRLSVALTAIFSWFIWLTPPPLRRWLATIGGDIFYRFFPTYRASVAENLRHVIPNASQIDIEMATRSIFRQGAHNFLDLFLIPHVARHAITRPDPLVDGSWTYLDDALAGGKGAIIMTAHVGPFDYIMQLLNQRGYKITSVTGRTTSRFVFDGVTWLRRRHNSAIVEASPSGIRKVFQALKRGECAAFLTDYDFSGAGYQVTMFGAQTRIPQGPVRIARDTGAPIVPLFSRRIGNRHHLILLPPFVVEKTKDIDADLREGLRRIVECLEHAIARTPDQWVMFQKLWPTDADADSPPDHRAAKPDPEPAELARA